ncbi:hypothetical protein [Mesorhizobium sp. BHbdii]
MEEPIWETNKIHAARVRQTAERGRALVEDLRYTLGRSVIRKGDRNENLNEKQDEADAVVGEPYPVALLLVLSILSMVGGAVYAVLRREEFL